MRLIGAAVIVAAIAPIAPGHAAPDFKAYSCFAVVDANNKIVGTLRSFDTHETVMATNGQLVTLLTGPALEDFAGDSGLGQANNFVFFLTPDCSGTPIVPGVTGFASPSAIAGSRSTLYATLPGLQSTGISVLSEKVSADDTCYSAPQDINGAPGQALFNLADSFTPPFHVVTNRCQ